MFLLSILIYLRTTKCCIVIKKIFVVIVYSLLVTQKNQKGMLMIVSKLMTNKGLKCLKKGKLLNLKIIRDKNEIAV